MNPRRHFDLADAAATEVLGATLAAALPKDATGWLILLKGDLGSGKSTLVRALLRRLGVEGPVPSPTYTLVEPYEIQGQVVYHVDLYRVSDASELRYLGWSDLRQGLVLVEWPERAPDVVREGDLEVLLDFAGQAGRTASLRALSPRAERLVDALQDAGRQPGQLAGVNEVP